MVKVVLRADQQQHVLCAQLDPKTVVQLRIADPSSGQDEEVV